MDFEEKNFELSQKMCNSLSLGAIYMQIYKKITTQKKKIDMATIQEIENKFNNLLSNVNTLISQYNKYENLITNIQYPDQRRELLQQNQEKISYLQEFKNNLEENIENIDIIKQNVPKKKSIYTNEVSLKLGEIKSQFKDIKKYFLDFGLFNTFFIQINNSDMCGLF